MIVQELQKIQERCGWLPPEELSGLSSRLAVPLHRLHEVASYYPLYRLKPPPKVDIKVCRDMACHMAGASRLRAECEAVAAEYPAGEVAVSGVSCLGRCDGAVAASVNDHHYLTGQTAEALRAVIASAHAGNAPHAHHHKAKPLGFKIDVYEGRPEYRALAKWLSNPDAAALLKELEASGLRGMGGAGFPTFRKWGAVRGAPGATKYVVCNADESEPGTFKDRELMIRAPWLVVEGIILAGLVVGAGRGWIYIRHEYPEAIDAVRAEIARARSAGILGKNILGKGASFELDVFVSPGGYVQGEESALLEAMEDRRGEPRNKPPFPVQHGLFNQSTVINNVATLANIPLILREGGAAIAALGTQGSKGRKLFCVSGDIARPGVYEFVFGITLRQLITQAGGVPHGRAIQSVLLGGAAGAFVGPDQLDVPLTFEGTRAIGATLGSGVVMVFDDTVDLGDTLARIAAFFRDESCGQCVPCRVGTTRQEELVQRLRRGKTLGTPADETALLDEISQVMRDASICGLGHTASSALQSAIRLFGTKILSGKSAEKNHG